MTTEEDFQAALDANSQDWHTRRVFADWLDDRGDPRASGYRAMAQQMACPAGSRGEGSGLGSWHGERGRTPKTAFEANSVLPDDWFVALWGEGAGEPYRMGNSDTPYEFPGEHKDRRELGFAWPIDGDVSRRDADDAAALAFLKLPEARRAELLNAEAPELRWKEKDITGHFLPAAEYAPDEEPTLADLAEMESYDDGCEDEGMAAEAA